TEIGCGGRLRLHRTSRSSARPRLRPRNAGTPSSGPGVAAVSACEDASRPTRRRRLQREAGGVRLAGDLPHLLTFPRGGNIDSPPRITLDSWRGADSLIERLDLLERLLEVFDQDVAVPPQVALVPHADEVRKESMQIVHVRLIEGLVVECVDRPDPLPPAVLVIMFALAILERDPEVGLAICLDVIDFQGVPDAALVHRSVKELYGLDGRSVEAGPPVPIAVRERVREHAPIRIRRLESEVHVDLVETLPDLPEVLDQGLVQFEPGDVLLSHVLDDFPSL